MEIKQMLSVFNAIMLMYTTTMYNMLQNNVPQEVQKTTETIIQQIRVLNNELIKEFPEKKALEENELTKEIPEKKALEENELTKEIPEKKALEEKVKNKAIIPLKNKSIFSKITNKITKELPVKGFLREKEKNILGDTEKNFVNSILPENINPQSISANNKFTNKLSVKNSTTKTGPILERAQFFPNMTVNITGAKAI